MSLFFQTQLKRLLLNLTCFHQNIKNTKKFYLMLTTIFKAITAIFFGKVGIQQVEKK